jgi:hypothetical protein
LLFATHEPSNKQPIYWMDAAWLLLGFFGFFRRIELIVLKMSDVQLVSHPGAARYIKVRVRKSKNGQCAHGVWVHISGERITG